VRIRDPDARQVESAQQYIKSELPRYKPTIRPGDVSVQVFQDLKPALRDAWLVIECVPEKLDLKIDTFAELEQLAPSDSILATNSSSYKSREIAAKVKPETARRMLNTHYFIPPKLRIVELMTSGSTHDEIFPFLQAHLRSSGMFPIVARRESTGFILNRVWAAVKRECLMVLSEGVATPEELDAAWTELFVKNAVRPCEMMDQVGLDTVCLIEQHYIAERGLRDPGLIPYLQRFINEGRLGAKSDKGGLYPAKQHTEPPGHGVEAGTSDGPGW
jgi:3-hydroxyacyl-CoA dehydrogenase